MGTHYTFYNLTQDQTDLMPYDAPHYLESHQDIEQGGRAHIHNALLHIMDYNQWSHQDRILVYGDSWGLYFEWNHDHLIERFCVESDLCTKNACPVCPTAERQSGPVFIHS